jgi:inhibitor of KinA
MRNEQTRIFPLGENALTIELANEISEPLNDRVLELFRHFERHPFPGFIESVPAYSSLTIFFDVFRVRAHFAGSDSAYEAVHRLANKAIDEASGAAAAKSGTNLIEVPVFFDDVSAPDMSSITEFSGLAREEVIDIFTSHVYRVYMLGFLPGFAYMGEVDKRIAVPRKPTPRLTVPKGSVGIAGRQTGIYPFESPGGWQIVGRTTMELFTTDDETPCFFAPGDHVKFYEVEEV